MEFVKKKFKKQFIFVFFAMCASFCITCDFSIVKPASSSIFISHYGVKYIPLAWLAVIPLNFLFVSLYNTLLSKIHPFPLFFGTVAMTMGLNVWAGLYAESSTLVPFIHYIIKDIYVLLMFQQVWSLIHVSMNLSSAKYVYGLIFGIGGLGSVAGSFITQEYAMKLGSEKLLFLTVPIYLFFTIFYYGLLKTSGGAHSKKEHSSDERGGFRLVGESRYLQCILLLVVAMQMSATFVEYQFSAHLERSFPEQDTRTAFIGLFFSYVNTITAIFQFVGSSLLMHFFGLLKSHFVVPAILAIFGVVNGLKPSFFVTSASYGTVKAVDYSLFRILTEMLYIPLSIKEKFAAKAVIDVFAYRSARGIASFVVLALGAFLPALQENLLNGCLLFICFLWLFAAAGVSRFYPKEQIASPH